MPVDLHLCEGTGTLHPATLNAASTEACPILQGTVCFDIPEYWQAPVLRVQTKAWLDLKEGRLRYRLSVGGIPGWMNHRMRIAETGPDYAGVLGVNQELQVAGWRNRTLSPEDRSITLMIYSTSLGDSLVEHIMTRSLNRRG